MPPRLRRIQDRLHGLLLKASTLQGFVVRSVAEGDQGIQRQPRIGVRLLKACLKFLLEQEPWVAGEVAHFDVILERELHDAVAGGFPKACVF